MIKSTATAFFQANDAETAFKRLRDTHHAATETRDAKAIASLYADNAFLYGPGGGVTKGKDAIFRDMSAFFSAFEQFTGSFVR
ncbi:MAG: nuclear transport factor 2 family protein, partial [Pseudomonadota bacterium]